MAKKALVSGYIGFNNFGDDAIFEEVIKNFQAKDVEISALSSNPAATEKRYNIKAYEYKNFKEILKAVWSTNILISGGGSLFQNGTSLFSLFYYASIIILAKLLGKKVIILGQGIGPIGGIFSNWLTAFCLKLANIVTIRDTSSFRFLKKHKISGKLFPDPVWSMKMPEYNPQGIIGIQVRDSYKITDVFMKNFAHFIGIFYSDKPIRVFLFQNNQDRKNATLLCSLVKKEYPNADIKIVEYTTVPKLLEDFSHLEKLIAMRYHACLVGYRLGIKTFCISYNKKIDELCRDFSTKCVQISNDLDFYREFDDFYNWEEPPIFKQKRAEKFHWEIFDSILK